MERTTALLPLSASEAGAGLRGPRRRRMLSEAKELALTSREREVLGLLAEGLSTAAVAQRLSISRVTVRNHVQRILGKLSAHTRLEALAAAYRLGVLKPPEVG